MKDRPRLIHLIAIAIALLVLAGVAWAYTSANDPVEGIPEVVKENPSKVEPTVRSTCAGYESLDQCRQVCYAKYESDRGNLSYADCYDDCEYRCKGADTFLVHNVYFPKVEPEGSVVDCGAVQPVKSTFPSQEPWGSGERTDEATNYYNSSEAAHSALAALLVGLNEAEKNQGYFTSIPEGVRIKSFDLDYPEGEARVDFTSELSKVAGSCRVESIRAQIEKTAMQFPAVKSVVITIEGGNPDEALQP